MISEVVQGKPIEVTGKPDLLEVSENLDNTRRHHGMYSKSKWCN